MRKEVDHGAEADREMPPGWGDGIERQGLRPEILEQRRRATAGRFLVERQGRDDGDAQTSQAPVADSLSIVDAIASANIIRIGAKAAFIAGSGLPDEIKPVDGGSAISAIVTTHVRTLPGNQTSSLAIVTVGLMTAVGPLYNLSIVTKLGAHARPTAPLGHAAVRPSRLAQHPEHDLACPEWAPGTRQDDRASRASTNHQEVPHGT